MINVKEYNIPNLRTLLKKCNEDTDAASIVYFGTKGRIDAELAVIVVKGREQVEITAQTLERLKLYTPGKPIAPNMPERGQEFPDSKS